MHPLVSVEWLAGHLGEPGLVVLDVQLGAAATLGVPGWQPFDLDGDLSDRASDLPHTMLSADAFTAEARRLGVREGSTVVAYDTVGVYASARAWWMFRSMGFPRVAVLDGGLPAWRAAGHALVPQAETGTPGDVTAVPVPGSWRSSAQVLGDLGDDAVAVLDARSAARFAGTAPEPRPGLRPGHMPGAASVPFESLLLDGRFRAPEELRAALAAAVGERRRLVTSCGSGVTACVLALAAELAGWSDISVYDGSWAEWGRPGELPVA